jgi:hypothetical protein
VNVEERRRYDMIMKEIKQEKRRGEEWRYVKMRRGLIEKNEETRRESHG